ncbi:MAG: hypothetical protein K8L99_15765 [Anaerolineae bacterium]|nr:hypothetical protein [Anaerolineae bacterium]
MSARSNQKKPEDMLLRVIRVAEILARGEDDTPTAAENGRQVQPVEPVERVSPSRRKTQAQRFHVS